MGTSEFRFPAMSLRVEVKSSKPLPTWKTEDGQPHEGTDEDHRNPGEAQNCLQGESPRLCRDLGSEHQDSTELVLVLANK